jgi:pimeloyl-ACP methyl ester carboxylesterase
MKFATGLRPFLHRVFLFCGVTLLAISATRFSHAEESSSTFVRKGGNADTVIVFVHGFFGDGRTSWTAANGTYWPTLLTTDPAFDETDIFVYSYPTGPSATMTVDELAENMRLVLTVNQIPNYHKIIFVSHSMGGLITRAYLLKNRNVAERTLFAYFFSTPTTGSQIASIANAVFSSPQLSKLGLLRPDEYLADLLRQWLAAQFSFPSYCAYEKRPTNGVSVVTMDSASALCTRSLDPIDTNHFDIVKPESQTSMSYLALKAAFAGPKIIDLKKQIDNAIPNKIAADVAEVSRFPNSPDKTQPPTLLETILINKLPQRIYRILENYNKKEIEDVENNGAELYQFKLGYYDYQSHVTNWEAETIKKIGQSVKVTFPAGWAMYLRYVELRLGANSQDKIIAGGSFLNYEITWDDCERVYLKLQSDPDFAASTKAIGLEGEALFKASVAIAAAVNPQSSARR